MDNTNAEIETSTAWSEEDSTNVGENDTAREGGVGTTSGSFGDISERVSRASSSQQGPVPGYTTNGKILTQLISDAEDRLEEAEACLEWYENVKQRELKRLANLRKLQEEEEQERQKQQAETQS